MTENELFKGGTREGQVSIEYKYRIMIRSIGKRMNISKVDPGLVNRVAGEAECPRCRLPYRDHPEPQPTFHVTCDGNVVKI